MNYIKFSKLKENMKNFYIMLYMALALIYIVVQKYI